jgi:hypothetical protein
MRTLRFIPVLTRETRRDLRRGAARTGRSLHGGTLLVLIALLFGTSAWAQQPLALPADVPNLLDPQVRAQYTPTVVGNLLANPDFPLVLLVHISGTPPAGVLVALDARNGSAAWSLGTDPIVSIALLGEAATITEGYIDRGLLEQGTPSGRFQSVPDPGETLPALVHALAGIADRTFL